MTDPEPNLLVSIHLAKTGGNTFATILERAATGMFCQFYGPDHPKTGLTLEGVQLTPLDETRPRSLFDRLLTVPSIAARGNVLHGHMNTGRMMDRYPYADFAIWLRDPIDRVVSHYEFWKRLDRSYSDDPLYHRFHEEDMTLEEFSAQPRVRNTQTRVIARRPVDDFAFVGITEHYNRSLDLFGRMYDVDTGDIIQLNRNPERTESGYALPDGTRAVVESNNERDLALYRQGLERFEMLDSATSRPLHPVRRLAAAARTLRARSPLRRPDGAPDEPAS